MTNLNIRKQLHKSTDLKYYSVKNNVISLEAVSLMGKWNDNLLLLLLKKVVQYPSPGAEHKQGRNIDRTEDTQI